MKREPYVLWFSSHTYRLHGMTLRYKFSSLSSGLFSMVTLVATLFAFCRVLAIAWPCRVSQSSRSNFSSLCCTFSLAQRAATSSDSAYLRSFTRNMLETSFCNYCCYIILAQIYIKVKSTYIFGTLLCLVTRTGIEPMIPP